MRQEKPRLSWGFKIRRAAGLDSLRCALSALPSQGSLVGTPTADFGIDSHVLATP